MEIAIFKDMKGIKRQIFLHLMIKKKIIFV